MSTPSSPLSSIQLDLINYRQFIARFREVVGIGFPNTRSALAPSAYAEVASQQIAYRFSAQDLYLTHTRSQGQQSWSLVQQLNYGQMGLPRPCDINVHKVKQAFAQPSLQGQHLATVILVTAEAARSKVIYQIVASLLGHSGASIDWHELEHLSMMHDE